MGKKNSNGKRKDSKSRNKNQRFSSVSPQQTGHVIINDTICHFEGMPISRQLNTHKNISSYKQKNSIGNNATSVTMTSSVACQIRCEHDTQTDTGPGLELAVYDPWFAQDQIGRHSGICVACRKQKYFMKTCKQCHVMKYCSRKCLSQHNMSDEQRAICVRNILFNKARENISLKKKENLLMKGYTEISSHLYSIPRREIYQMMGSSRSVILMQVIGVNFNPLIGITEVLVQDVDGCTTLLHLYPPPGTKNFWDLIVWIQKMQLMLSANTFILLFNAHWNAHADKISAAVDVTSEQQIQVIHHTEQILKSARQKDLECLHREIKKFATNVVSSIAT